MKNLNRMTLMTTMAMACAGAFAQAEPTYNPSWYITPSISWFHPDSKFGNDEDGAGVGLRFGKPISESFDVQFGATFARADHDGLRYDQTMVGADLLWMLSRSNFRPFLLFGAGGQRDETSGSAVVSDTKDNSGYLNAGIGFQYDFSEQWSSQVDLRRVHGYLDEDHFGFDRNNNTYLTFGLTYIFEPRPKPVVVAKPQPVPPAPVAPAPAPRFEHQTVSSTELFAFDSAELGASTDKLDEIAAALNKDTTANNVVITGYTDRLGSSKYNHDLSQRRAEAVKTYLVGKGVSAERLTTEGKGEENPLVECKQKKRADLIKCLEPNRRVEVEPFTVQKRVN